MLFTVMIIFYVIVCVSLIVIVLLQSGKGGGLAGVFGSGGGSQAIFGARTGDVMTKTTTALAILFMVLSLVLAILSGNRSRSLTEEIDKLGLDEKPPAALEDPGEASASVDEEAAGQEETAASEQPSAELTVDITPPPAPAE